VKLDWSGKNGLERELQEYDSVIFPERPPELQEEYELRKKEQIENHNLREKKAKKLRVAQSTKDCKSSKNVNENGIVAVGRSQQCQFGGETDTNTVLDPCVVPEAAQGSNQQQSVPQIDQHKF